MKRTAMITVVFSLAALSVHGAEVDRGIEYGRGATRGGDKPLLLDLYRPDTLCSAPRPLVVMIHGGAFRYGARHQPPWPGFATDLADAGYVVASIDYRLQGDHPLPSQPFAAMGRDLEAAASLDKFGAGCGWEALLNAALSAFEDAATAVNWLQDNAARHCIDPERIALWGASAGAITALHTAYSLDDYGIALPAFRAVIDLWGGLPVDAHLEAGEAPLFIVHGTRDTVVPYRQTLEIEARAREVGVPAEIHAIEGAGHGFQAIGIRTRTVDGMTLFNHILDFLDRQLNHTLDFAYFGNGTSLGSDLVLVNVAAHPIRPAISFYDQGGHLMDAESVVDVIGDLAVTEDGALTVRTEMEPLGELTISTHGRGEVVSGSVSVVAEGPIGGVLRLHLPSVGVAAMVPGSPLRDALFPVRRQAGGIRTALAIRNLERGGRVVRCQLMKAGAVLEQMELPLQANGQQFWFIEEVFTGADTSDFVGAVRCASPGRFTAVAVELDAANRIFTTLPAAPVQGRTHRE